MIPSGLQQSHNPYMLVARLVYSISLLARRLSLRTGNLLTWVFPGLSTLLQTSAIGNLLRWLLARCGFLHYDSKWSMGFAVSDCKELIRRNDAAGLDDMLVTLDGHLPNPLSECLKNNALECLKVSCSHLVKKAAHRAIPATSVSAESNDVAKKDFQVMKHQADLTSFPELSLNEAILHCRSTEALELLLEFGARPSICFGRHPVDVHAMNGRMDICAKLMDLGSCPSPSCVAWLRERGNFRSAIELERLLNRKKREEEHELSLALTRCAPDSVFCIRQRIFDFL